MDDRLYSYLLAHTREPEVLASLRAATAAQFPSGARMQISPEQGAFMGWLLGTLGARRVIEVRPRGACWPGRPPSRMPLVMRILGAANPALRAVLLGACLFLHRDPPLLSSPSPNPTPRPPGQVGTFTGYSSIAMALALPSGATLLACDRDPKAMALAREYWGKAGVADKVRRGGMRAGGTESLGGGWISSPLERGRRLARHGWQQGAWGCGGVAQRLLPHGAAAAGAADGSVKGIDPKLCFRSPLGLATQHAASCGLLGAHPPQRTSPPGRSTSG